MSGHQRAMCSASCLVISPFPNSRRRPGTHFHSRGEWSTDSNHHPTPWETGVLTTSPFRHPLHTKWSKCSGKSNQVPPNTSTHLLAWFHAPGTSPQCNVTFHWPLVILSFTVFHWLTTLLWVDTHPPKKKNTHTQNQPLNKPMKRLWIFLIRNWAECTLKIKQTSQTDHREADETLTHKHQFSPSDKTPSWATYCREKTKYIFIVLCINQNVNTTEEFF